MARLNLAAIDGDATDFDADSTGRMARGPKMPMRKTVSRDLSDGSNEGTLPSSFAKMPACVSAASSIWRNKAAFAGSRSDAATAPER